MIVKPLNSGRSYREKLAELLGVDMGHHVIQKHTVGDVCPFIEFENAPQQCNTKGVKKDCMACWNQPYNDEVIKYSSYYDNYIGRKGARP